MSSDGTTERILGRTILPGKVSGELLVLDWPLSLWGGIDLTTGVICNQSHPQRGCSLKNRILVMESGRGSSSSSSALVEATRKRVGPLAILMAQVDGILAMGALVAEDLYDIQVPIVVVIPEDWRRLASGSFARVEAAESGARVELTTRSARR